MDELVSYVKQRARRLHAAARAGRASAWEAIGELQELAEVAPEERGPHLKRRHVLAAIARRLGFSGWPHARAVLAGAVGGETPDLGELMHRESGGAYWNIWSARYDEARAIREEHGGYLLAYRRHLLIVEAPYVSYLGVDPDDPDWARIGRDWVRPAERAAWARLTQKVVDARLGAEL